MNPSYEPDFKYLGSLELPGNGCLVGPLGPFTPFPTPSPSLTTIISKETIDPAQKEGKICLLSKINDCRLRRIQEMYSSRELEIRAHVQVKEVKIILTFS